MNYSIPSEAQPRIYAEYYSKRHQSFLKGQIFGRQGNRLKFRVIDRSITEEILLVPPRMISNFVVVNDSGVMKDLSTRLSTDSLRFQYAK